MDFYEVIGARRSIRSFKKDPPPLETLERILEAAREAPSANNLMPWKLVVVSEPDSRAALATGTYGKFLADAPVVIVGCGDRKASPEWFAVDTAIALEHVVLAATAEGLGSCWVGSFDKTAVMNVIGIPEGFEVIALIALGAPKEKFDIARRASQLIHPTKTLSSVVSMGNFEKPWFRA